MHYIKEVTERQFSVVGKNRAVNCELEQTEGGAI